MAKQKEKEYEPTWCCEVHVDFGKTRSEVKRVGLVREIIYMNELR
jgi:hypothetical protein